IPAVEQHIKRFGAPPKAVAADRGFSSKENEKELENMGVGRVSIPVKGKKSKNRAQHEGQLWFKHLQRFRAGGEARISLLKRKYGLNLSRYRGLVGSRTWVGLGIWAYNLTRAAQLLR
ncbi:MAG: transposase, partial [Peptococcaceae bacterium]|nr:transposase [Peptococcaceae bacterium]